MATSGREKSCLRKMRRELGQSPTEKSSSSCVSQIVLLALNKTYFFKVGED